MHAFSIVAAVGLIRWFPVPLNQDSGNNIIKKRFTVSYFNLKQASQILSRN
jgi:hypothetical protein